jgi:hypothetical protein
MPSLYYDTNSAAPLHALPRRVKTDRDRPVDPDNPEAVGILRLVKATPTEGFRIEESHGETRTDADGKVVAWVEVIDATKSLAEVEAEERAAAMPKPEVVEAAMQLYEEIGRINATYKINLGIGSGYNATLNDVLKNPSIPVELRSLDYNILTNRFDQYAYRFGQWRENADAWAALADLAAMILQQPVA